MKWREREREGKKREDFCAVGPSLCKKKKKKKMHAQSLHMSDHISSKIMHVT